jgi:mono/diheme cytochrome c family protein
VDPFATRPHQEAIRVIARWFGSFARRCAGLLPIVLGVSMLSGCEQEGYPETLVYPQRTDPLVNRNKQVTKDAPSYDRPGDFPQVIFYGLTPEERDAAVLFPEKMKAEDRQQLEKSLTGLFGTPAHPKVGGVSEQVVAELKLDPETLACGSATYRHQCLHCHGLTGDGRGPTSGWVNPHPRDYRQGIFKFTSSKQAEGERKPRREDLLRTLREGINGTSMPSFRLQPDDELEALASYVIHLSMRGETEFVVMKEVILGVGDPDDTIDTRVNDALTQRIGRWWQQAQHSLIEPGPYPQYKSDDEFGQSVKRGFGLFSRANPEGNLKTAGCLACHIDFGRQSLHKYDYWGTVVRPADLTTGIYRGGRRPIDLYWRIHSGVNGVTMPASGTLSPDEIWDIVNFLQVLPYPKMLKKYGIELEETK